MQTKFNGGVGWKANEACKIAYPLETKNDTLQTGTILRYNKLHIQRKKSDSDNTRRDADALKKGTQSFINFN